MATNGDLPVAGQSIVTHRRVELPAMPEIPPSDHETMKAELRPHLKRYAQNIIAGITKDPPERNAMNLYGRVMGMIGADVEVSFNVLSMRELGCTVEEAKRKMALVASVEGIDYEGAMSVIEQELRAFWGARGYRIMIVKDDVQEIAP